ncbi:tRNA (guanine-N(7)-)-methyltransferase-like [Impatiens glandulifera]|uniref:tRNA (guanine-N(7)-)-methyltransferase-like n=1 Tax=Impatiens glandulifera TaxID=253017 RepID=UPI001FB0CA39|nr:tRNA (guanine-N(7)-)-methyltransferase-like [Impatiens glandulifera]
MYLKSFLLSLDGTGSTPLRMASCSVFPSRFLFFSFPSQNLRPSKIVHLSRRRYLPFRSTATAVKEGQVIRSPGLIAIEYADLSLPNKAPEDLGQVRLRQHVNPLSASFSVPTPAPDWSQVYKDTTLPLMVDIGCGSGRFVLWLGKRNQGSTNYLGLEIREKLVKRADSWLNDLGLRNVHFMYANATISFKDIVSTYPGPLMFVSILCPDPHFKKRHHKRRVLQTPLVDSIASRLMPGGQVFIQSDVFEVALDMRSQFDVHSTLLHIDTMHCDKDGWLLENQWE